MPDQRTLEQMYSPEYLTTCYPHAENGSRELERELHETARKAARLRPRGRLLDVGCGAGGFLLATRDAGLLPEGHELIAATAEVTAERTGLPVHAGPLDALAGGYDVVHLADVVEHHPSPVDLLSAARDRLAPDGVLVARGPLENQDNLFQTVVRSNRVLLRRLGRARPIEIPPWHVTQFTLRGWRALLARAGLRPIDERVYEISWPAPESLSLRPAALLRRLSRTVSGLAPGRALHLGNRVVSVLAAASR
jgi:SAM-dependent methyltransferase